MLFPVAYRLNIVSHNYIQTVLEYNLYYTIAHMASVYFQY